MGQIREYEFEDNEAMKEWHKQSIRDCRGSVEELNETLTPEEQVVADRLEEIIERHLNAGYKGPETKSIHLNLPEATPRILAYLRSRFTGWNIGSSDEGGPGNLYSFEPK